MVLLASFRSGSLIRQLEAVDYEEEGEKKEYQDLLNHVIRTPQPHILKVS